jgi:hypothetical protein
VSSLPRVRFLGTVKGTYPVLPSQRNDAFREIEADGLDPREFHWEESPSGLKNGLVVDQIVHTRTGFYFRFDRSDRGHYSFFSPGSDDTEESQHPGTWSNQVAYFRKWLGYLARELSQPSLWEALAAGEPLLQAGLASGIDSPFGPDEIRAIEVKIVEARAYLSTELEPGRLAAVNRKLDLLLEASHSQGRQTWIFFALGVLITLVWGGMMSPGQAQAVMVLLGQAFQRLISG